MLSKIMNSCYIFVCSLISIILLIPLPWMLLVIATGLVWDKLWLKFSTTPLANYFSVKLSKASNKIAPILMRDERNSPYLYTLFGIGLFIPTLFISIFIWHMHYGLHTKLLTLILIAFIYHVLLMGPYFRFFAYVATVTHKEGHDIQGIYKKPYKFLNYAFGWFIAPFYGHVPESYPIGHVRIHHRYNNNKYDVISTLNLDRTHPRSWFIYLRKFALMWCGLSNLLYFIRRDEWHLATRMFFGMLAFYGITLIVMMFNPWFGFAYLVLPHMSVIIYLSAINFVWHAFCDPADPDNPYINSVTILNGHYNVFNEDYHAVHHFQPNLQWTLIPNNFNNDIDKYRQNMGSIFTNTMEFEIFTWIMLRRFDLLADHFVDLTGKFSQEEKIALLKYRMQPINNL